MARVSEVASKRDENALEKARYFEKQAEFDLAIIERIEAWQKGIDEQHAQLIQKGFGLIARCEEITHLPIKLDRHSRVDSHIQLAGLERVLVEDPQTGRSEVLIRIVQFITDMNATDSNLDIVSLAATTPDPKRVVLRPIVRELRKRAIKYIENLSSKPRNSKSCQVISVDYRLLPFDIAASVNERLLDEARRLSRNGDQTEFKSYAQKTLAKMFTEDTSLIDGYDRVSYCIGPLPRMLLDRNIDSYKAEVACDMITEELGFSGISVEDFLAYARNTFARDRFADLRPFFRRIGCDWSSTCGSDDYEPMVSDVSFRMPEFLKRFSDYYFDEARQVDDELIEHFASAKYGEPVTPINSETERKIILIVKQVVLRLYDGLDLQKVFNIIDEVAKDKYKDIEKMLELLES